MSHLILTSPIFCTKNTYQNYIIKLHGPLNVRMFIYQLYAKHCVMEDIKTNKIQTHTSRSL